MNSRKHKKVKDSCSLLVETFYNVAEGQYLFKTPVSTLNTHFYILYIYLQHILYGKYITF